MTASPRRAESARHLSEITHAFFQAVDPVEAVRRVLKLEPAGMVISGHRIALAPEAHVYMAAIGKAAPGMAQAAAGILGSRVTRGVVTMPHGFRAAHTPRLEYISAGHPFPDEGSLAAGQAARHMLINAQPRDVLLALVSGGGSAMFEIPLAEISLNDLQTVNGLLIRSAATIHEINLVRQSLSAVKRGGLATLAAPARTVALLISDVVGDIPESIASGPTVPASGKPESVHAILKRYQLDPLLPSSVRRALGESQVPVALPTPPLNLLVANNSLGLQAARGKAVQLGFSVQLVPEPLQGETHEAARAFALALRRAAPPACLLIGGETTLAVQGGGRGGRNQSFALAAAVELQGDPRLILAAISSDGVDGPTDAAGAVVDGSTGTQLHRLGIDPTEQLRRRDAYPALEAAGALIFGGPTGTNVGDFVIGLVYP